MATEKWKEKNIDKLREYRRNWYHKNKQKAKKEIKKRKKEIKKWFNNYKSTLKCEQCNFNHPAALDFHHINPEEKDLVIAKVIGNGWSKIRILEEVSKCQVLCSNCHRILHWG
jgi:hypothetical protein